MSESVKTACFVGLALVIGLGAYVSRPVPHKKHKGEDTPVELFEGLKDPLEVTRLEIVQYDEASQQVKKPFEVAQVVARDGKTRWAIPSHFDYPADAKDHLAEAASLLMGIKSVNTAPGMGEEGGDLDQNNIRRLHNEYGVVDPDPAAVKSSDTGVGTRITLKNKEGKTLASLIVGKTVGEQGGQRYVRYPDKDSVYIVDIDPSKVSTKFEDWIERNLLGMNTMDLKQVHIQDYSIVPVEDGLGEKLEGDYLLDYNFSGTPAWTLTKDLVFDKAKKDLVPKVLAADEELDTAKLDSLKSAIDDLKIVDVERKPAAIPPDLRLRNLADRVSLSSLQERGFFPAPDPDGVKGHFCIMSTKGDVALQLSDGACYVLRFGESTGQSSAADKSKDKKDPKKEVRKDEPTTGSNRYMFVMAEFNQAAVAKPAFEEFPKEEKKADEKKTDDKKPDDKKADEKKPDAKDPKPAADAGKKDAAKKDEPKKDEPKKDEKKVDVKAERERIEKDNKRKREEYDEKVAAGKKHVKELNDRFADWYYVISDDVYRKIHLARADFIKKKEAKDKDKDKDKDKPKDAADHDHDHDHAHEHDALPPSPAGTIEQLKKDAPPAPEKK